MLQNSEAEKYFEPLSAHSDIAEVFLAALKPLGEYECRRGAKDYGALYAVTNGFVFCGTAGMAETYWRLRPSDRRIALATGASMAELGPDWVKFTSFQSDWPKLDLPHWALKAYDFARTGK